MIVQRSQALRKLLLPLAILVLWPGSASAAQTGTTGSRPNFLLIVADDLGYSDFTPFGGEIPTPALQALAEEGLRMGSFYTAPTCSPARAMLFSGVDNHKAGIGTMREVLDRYPDLQNQPGYEGYLLDSVYSLPDILRRNGYRTYMSGKWHLGEKRGHWPVDKGFDRSFALLQAGASHYDSRLPLFPPSEGLDYLVSYVEDGAEVPLPDDFYSSRDYADKLIGYLDTHPDDAPFFAYLAFTAPHDPLHSPPEWSAKFKGWYDEGYDALRERRIDAVTAQGLLPPDVAPAARLPHVQPWDELPHAAQTDAAHKMEIYAGMVANMDHQIGRVVNALKERGLYDNTVIIFFSDNGANGNQYERYPRTMPDWLPENFDNNRENWGKKGSRISVGAGWAHASMAPFRLLKFFTAEGGIRSPFIAAGPGITRRGETDAGTVAHIMDIAPTLYAMAGITLPEEIDGINPAPVQGQSMAAYFGGAAGPVHDDYIGWELFGSRAIRKGDWKLLWVNRFDGTPGGWELFNIATDPAETRDLADSNPAKLDELKADWADYVARNGVIDISNR